MDNKEVEKVLEELQEVRPEKLTGDRDRMINKMAEFLIGFPVFNYNGEIETSLKDKEDVIKYFEERCNNEKN